MHIQTMTSASQDPVSGNADPNNLGRQLQQRRKSLGLTQRQVADFTGVSVRFVHELEHGKQSVHLGKVSAVAGLLGLELGLVPRKLPSDAARTIEPRSND